MKLLPAALSTMLLVSALPARAQTVQDGGPAHVELVEGQALVDRDNQSEPAVASQPLLEGDRLHTDAGRLEVLFSDGSALYVDEHTTLDLLSDSLLRLMEGRMTLVIVGSDRGFAPYQIDAPAASVRIDRPGQYRLSAPNGGTGQLELAVVSGAAVIATDAGSAAVLAGQRSAVRNGLSPSSPQPFNSARLDEFDRWTAERRTWRMGAISTQYLPPETQAYAGTFDRYGTWGYEPVYGYVWYPTAVVPGWRPYYDGYWGVAGRFGWTWIGHERWAWPTHHFGRWGLARGTWFWIPGQQWSGGWVNWAIAPGYVGWCPVGFDGRPIASFFSVSYRSGIGFDPWSAWTLVPQQAFGTRMSFARRTIDGRSLPQSVRTTFVMQQRAPAVSRTAVVRGVGARPDPQRNGAPRTGFPSAPLAGRETALSTSVRSRDLARVPTASSRDAVSRVGQRTSTAGSTRIAAPRVPMVGSRAELPYRGPGFVESPYTRAERVMLDRQPGTGRQPLPSGVDPSQYGSPYPPQYRSVVPEPFRPQLPAPQSSPTTGWGPYNWAVPRGTGLSAPPMSGLPTLTPLGLPPAAPQGDVSGGQQSGVGRGVSSPRSR